MNKCKALEQKEKEKKKDMIYLFEKRSIWIFTKQVNNSNVSLGLGLCLG